MKKSPVLIVGSLIIVVILLFGWNSFSPGQYDAFAQCLEDEGALFYGAFWCSNCIDQKALFGNSDKELPYIECSTSNKREQLPVCQDAQIEGYPTWEFSDGSREVGVLTLKELSEKTGCLIP